MQKFRTIQDVNGYLASLKDETRRLNQAYTLDRMKQLMRTLGNPQDSYKTIHVAGTSGKSSTCYYISSMLAASGQKVGMTVSPHVYRLSERVQIDTTPLEDKQFTEDFAQFIEQVGASDMRPTYFELLVAFAYWEFARQQVDFAVIEVGLGGLLDGTNVIDRADKVCVITDIGYDHTSKLGKTLSDITAQKAGIITPTNTVFSYDQDEVIMRVLREVCEQHQAVLHEIWPVGAAELPRALPLYQRRNWYLALRVTEFVCSKYGIPEPDETALARTVETYIPARMEQHEHTGKTIVLDAAHNQQKLNVLYETFRHAFGKQPVACMVSFAQAKQAKLRDSLRELLPLVNHVIITDYSLGDPNRLAADPQVVAKLCQSLGAESVELIPDPKQAFHTLQGRPEDLLLITGTFFLPEIVRPLIIKKT